jgi:HEAT repeat protein
LNAFIPCVVVSVLATHGEDTGGGKVRITVIHNERAATIERLMGCISNKKLSHGERRAAIAELGKLKAVEVVDRLCELVLADPRPLTADLVWLLGEIRSPKAIPALESLVNNFDSGGPLTAAVVVALSRIRGGGSIGNFYIPKLENERLTLERRIDAAEQLGEYGAVVVLPRMLKLLPGKYDKLTVAIVKAVGEIGDPAAVPVLQQIYAKAPPGMRTHIETALQKCGGSVTGGKAKSN